MSVFPVDWASVMASWNLISALSWSAAKRSTASTTRDSVSALWSFK